MSRARMISVPSSFATHTSVTSMRASSRPLSHSAGYRLCRPLSPEVHRRLACPSLGRTGADQEGQDLADGAFPPVRFRQRKVRLDMVAVPAAVLLLDHVTALDQARDDAERAAFRDIQAGRDVAQAHPGVMSHAQEYPGVVSQEGPARHPRRIPDSGNNLLVS